MSSTKTWVIFEEKNTAPQRKNPTTTTEIQNWLSDNDGQMAQSDGFDQLKIISLNFAGSKYSVFDSLRRREEKGDYLGWSKAILGQSQ